MIRHWKFIPNLRDHEFTQVAPDECVEAEQRIFLQRFESLKNHLRRLSRAKRRHTPQNLKRWPSLVSSSNTELAAWKKTPSTTFNALECHANHWALVSVVGHACKTPTCGTELYLYSETWENTLVRHPWMTLLWKTLGWPLHDTLVKQFCETVMWNKFARHTYETLRCDTCKPLVKHFCKTLLWNFPFLLSTFFFFLSLSPRSLCLLSHSFSCILSFFSPSIVFDQQEKEAVRFSKEEKTVIFFLAYRGRNG